MTGLYIHIPFCIKKCNYCDFNSQSGNESLFSDYVLCIKKEIEKIKSDGIIFDSVYIGGGTPTVLPSSLLSSVIESITNIKSDAEITVEANPKTVDFEKLSSILNAGANRLSLGLQSVNDGELKMLGRAHTFPDFEETYFSARRAGFKNISIDLMFALPNQTTEIWKHTLKKAVSYNPDHISAYCLKIEKGTPFEKMKLNLPNDDTAADMYDLCTDFLENHGYKRYEISNFAKDNKESFHNNLYWKTQDYIGIGAGAHSCFGGKRFSKIYDTKKYINAINSGDTAVENTVLLTTNDKMSEFVFLGLRMTNGISENEFYSRFNLNIDSVFGKQLQKYEKLGVIERKSGRIFINPKFLYVSNSILSDFV